MSDSVRWVIIIVAVVLVLGLVAFARGGEHRRGDDEGSSARAAPRWSSSAGTLADTQAGEEAAGPGLGSPQRPRPPSLLDALAPIVVLIPQPSSPEGETALLPASIDPREGGSYE